MSNEISKFYQFLANQGQNWAEITDTQYGNSDGSVIKAEFSKFINAEWDGEEMGLTLTKDLVNQFWKKIDSNQSTTIIKGSNNIRNYNALDDKELENLDKRIVAYQQFNEYADEYIQSSGVLTTTESDWRNDVEAELMVHLEEWITSGSQGDLTAYLEQYRPSVENKYTAQYCAIEYQNELLKDVLKDYPEYKIGDDSTLQDMLQEYLNGFASMETQPSPETIKNEIRSIIDAYFATAGIGNGSDYDLSSLGYTQNADSPLNDIQKAKLTAKLKSNLAEITSDPNYEKYKDLYDEAINDFISGIVDSTKFSEFETVLGQGIEEFKATDEYKTLMNRIEVTTVLGDLSVGSYFYNAIKRKLGQTLADKFSQDAGVLPDAFNEIINQAIEKVLNGEFLKQNAHIVYPGTSTAQSVAEAASTSFTSGGITINPTYTLYNGNLNISELLDWVTDQLAIRLDEIYTNGYGEMELEELNNVYDKLFDTADELQGDEKLSMYRNTAINYIEALMDMGYADALKDVIGDDYKAKINQMLPSDINDLLDNIKQVVDEIEDLSKCYISSWFRNYDEGVDVTTGGSTNLQLKANVFIGVNSIDSSRVSYKAAFSGAGTGTINESTGEVTITGGSTAGTMTIKVTVFVDGIEIKQDPLVITVRVNTLKTTITKEELGNPDPAWVNITDKMTNCGRNYSKTLENTVVPAAIAGITNVINELKESLRGQGYNETQLESTCDALISYYTALLNAISDHTKAADLNTGGTNYGVNFTYNLGGQEVSETTTYYEETRVQSKKVDMSNCYKSASGIMLGEWTTGPRGYRISIDMSKVYEKFVEFFNKLA